VYALNKSVEMLKMF